MKRTAILSTLAALFALAVATFCLADDQKPASKPEETAISQPPHQPAENAASSANYQLGRLSLNSAGAINATSASYELGLSVGQPLTGTASSASYQMGLGFWYGGTVGPGCLAKPGDANASGTYTLADVIAIVNYIFNKPGCSPTPLCWLSNLLCRGDWDGGGTVSLSDVIRAVNYIFNKPGGPWNAVPVGVCCLP